MKLEFFQQTFKNTKISNLKEIGSVAAELFHVDGQTDMKKLRVFFFLQFC